MLHEVPGWTSPPLYVALLAVLALCSIEDSVETALVEALPVKSWRCAPPERPGAVIGSSAKRCDSGQVRSHPMVLSVVLIEPWVTTPEAVLTVLVAALLVFDRTVRSAMRAHRGTRRSFRKRSVALHTRSRKSGVVVTASSGRPGAQGRPGGRHGGRSHGTGLPTSP